LELKKAVTAPYPSVLTTYQTEDAARASARDGQEVLRFTDIEERPQQFIIVEPAPVITGEDIRSAYAVSSDDTVGSSSISFTLKESGAEKFSEWTRNNIGAYLAIVLDGSVTSAPYIRGEIKDMGTIDGSFTKASAEEIALNLNSGHLPAKLIVISERPFGN
jgi:preprotein translocase subunit SecD